MKSQGAAKNEANNVAQAKTVSEKPVEKIDFSKVEIEPLFKDEVDFETFSKSDFAGGGGMDSDIGNFEKKGTRRKIVCFVCGFGH